MEDLIPVVLLATSVDADVVTVAGCSELLVGDVLREFVVKEMLVVVAGVDLVVAVELLLADGMEVLPVDTAPKQFGCTWIKNVKAMTAVLELVITEVDSDDALVVLEVAAVTDVDVLEPDVATVGVDVLAPDVVTIGEDALATDIITVGVDVLTRDVTIGVDVLARVVVTVGADVLASDVVTTGVDVLATDVVTVDVDVLAPDVVAIGVDVLALGAAVEDPDFVVVDDGNADGVIVLV